MGKSLMECHNPESVEKIRKVVAWFAQNRENNIVYTYYNEKENKDFSKLTESINNINVRFKIQFKYLNKEQ